MCIITFLIKGVETGEVSVQEFVSLMAGQGWTEHESLVMLGMELSNPPPVVHVCRKSLAT